MAPNQEERIKILKLQPVAFKVELESFQAVLDTYSEGASATIIRIYLEVLKPEFGAFKEIQSRLDDIDDGRS